MFGEVWMLGCWDVWMLGCLDVRFGSALTRSTADGSADNNSNNNNINDSGTNNNNRMSVRLWLRQLGRVFVGLLGLRVDLK